MSAVRDPMMVPTRKEAPNIPKKSTIALKTWRAV